MNFKDVIKYLSQGHCFFIDDNELQFIGFNNYDEIFYFQVGDETVVFKEENNKEPMELVDNGFTLTGDDGVKHTIQRLKLA